jgi:drug/metabolite transporter (DMT)-like permease
MQDKVRKYFSTPGGYLNLRMWWLETRTSMLLGGLIGVGVSFLVLLLFMYPVFAGYTSGAVIAGALAVLTYFIAHYLYNLRFSRGKGSGIFALVVGLGLAIFAFVRVSALTSTGVAAIQTYPEWLFLNGLLLGILGGTSYGNYRTLSRRKSQALSFIISLALIATVLALIWLVGLFDLPFQFIG